MELQNLMKSCRLGDLALLRTVNSALLNEREEATDWTPLYCAGVFGHAEAVKLLLSQGADPDTVATRGDTLLHYAMASGQHKVALRLLEAGAIVNPANEGRHQADGDTPLHLACTRGDLKGVRLLLKFRATTTSRNAVGRTPLHCAVEAGHSTVVRYLIRNGASPVAEDQVRVTQDKVRPVDLSRTEDMTQALMLSSQSTPSTNPANPSPDPKDDLSVGTTSPLSSCISSPELVEFRQIEEKIKRLQDMNQLMRDSLGSHSPTIKPVRPSTPETMMKDDGRFLSWLAALRLESLYPCLLEAGFDDLPQLFNQMRSNSPLTEKVLEEVGVNKPGQRLILLAALERDSKPFSTDLTQVRKEHRLGLCCEVQASAPMVVSFPTLKGWLEALGLGHLQDVFEEMGFCEVEQMLLVMHSSRPLDESFLREIGVNKVGHRHRLLCKLQEDSLHFDPWWPYSPTPLRVPASPRGCTAM